MATTIGTSTNILVLSIANGLGLPSFEIFSFFPLAFQVALPGLLYLWLVAPRLLPNLDPLLESTGTLRVFDAWLYVTEESLTSAQTLSDVLARAPIPMRILDLRRGENLSLTRLPTIKLHTDDRLLVRDSSENLRLLSDELRMPLHDISLEDDSPAELAQSDNFHFAELVVSADSRLVGSTIGQARLAEQTGLIVVGIRHVEAALQTKRETLNRAVLHAGDVVLVQATDELLDGIRKSGDFLVLDERLSLPRTKKAMTSLAIVAAVVAAAATGTLPISVAAFGGVFVLLIMKCLTWDELRQALNTNVILIVVASLSLGTALTATGATDYLARAFVFGTRGLEPAVVLSGMMLLIALITNLVSNTAAAAIGTPVAMAIAQQLGVAPQPFVLGVLFAANLCFVTPIGYQTNLLVMGAVGYRFRDFFVVGTPLLLIVWAMLSWLLPLHYPLGPAR